MAKTLSAIVFKRIPQTVLTLKAELSLSAGRTYCQIFYSTNYMTLDTQTVNTTFLDYPPVYTLARH